MVVVFVFYDAKLFFNIFGNLRQRPQMGKHVCRAQASIGAGAEGLVPKKHLKNVCRHASTLIGMCKKNGKCTVTYAQV